MRGIGESCGIFAAYGVPDAAQLAYPALFALQHRGQESAGIVVADGETIRSVKGPGLLDDVVTPEELAELPGHLAIGHVRYSTMGGKKRQNIQPLVMEYAGGLLAVAHNGQLVNARTLRRECEARGSIFQTSTDSEIVVHLLARPENLGLERPLAHCLSLLRGAFSFVFLARDSVIAARDPRGFRPLAMGRLGEGTVFASETCVFDLLGAEYLRDVEPGEILTVDAGGVASERIERSSGVRPGHCIFEHIYFARPDSYVFGESVHAVRTRFGERLAADHPCAADVVCAVPDSGRSAALGYARASGIPFERGFIRNHYVGRSFIMPEQRGRTVDIKLNPVREVVSGKRVVVVDDSIIRGTTSLRRFKLLRQAGAEEIHVRIAAPPCACPCFYGIDFPSREELIAADRSVEEIREFLGVDSLGYLSVESLLAAMARPDDYCTACFSGEYPEPVDERAGKLALENPGRVEPG